MTEKTIWSANEKPQLTAIRANPASTTAADVQALIDTIDFLREEVDTLNANAQAVWERCQGAEKARDETHTAWTAFRNEQLDAQKDTRVQWTALGQALLAAARELRQTGAEAPLWAALAAIEEKGQAHAKRS